MSVKMVDSTHTMMYNVCYRGSMENNEEQKRVLNIRLNLIAAVYEPFKEKIQDLHDERIYIGREVSDAMSLWAITLAEIAEIDPPQDLFADHGLGVSVHTDLTIKDLLLTREDFDISRRKTIMVYPDVYEEFADTLVRIREKTGVILYIGREVCKAMVLWARHAYQAKDKELPMGCFPEDFDFVYEMEIEHEQLYELVG
jgi:hypothetical protein